MLVYFVQNFLLGYIYYMKKDKRYNLDNLMRFNTNNFCIYYKHHKIIHKFMMYIMKKFNLLYINRYPKK